MRRLSIAFTSLLLAVFMLAVPAPAHPREMVSIARSAANMRAGPGTGHEVLWTLGRGYPLEVTGRRGAWVAVRDFESDTGWVNQSLVNRTPHFVVKAPVANLRSGPSTSARVVGRAEYGNIVKTLERRDGWVRVRKENGRNGWIARRLLWGW